MIYTKPDHFDLCITVKTIPNIVNYVILFIAIILAFVEFHNDYRMYLVVALSTIVQISTCTFITRCRGISIIYCFLFGFIFAEYFKEKRKETGHLVAGFIVALVVSYFTLQSLNYVSLNDCLIFVRNHCLFILVGSMFSFLPEIQMNIE